MTDEGGIVFMLHADLTFADDLKRLLSRQGYSVEVFPLATALFERIKAGVSRGCLLLDLRLPDRTGLQVQEQVDRMGCVLPAVFVSGEADVQSAVQAMKGGAVDVLTTPVDSSQLYGALSNALEQASLLLTRRAARAAAGERFARLTRRELQVCTRLLDGWLNKQIGAELGIAEKTVKFHRARVMQKLGVASVAELVRIVDPLFVASSNSRSP